MIAHSSFKNWRYSLLFSCLCLFSSFATKHALYIGVVQITMEETMTVQVKVFSDDLQAILQSEVGYYKIGAIKDLCKAQTENLQKYFQHTLQIHINEQLIELTLADCEQINDVHLLHFNTTSSPASWQQVLINANFFMELFPTQSNVVQLRYVDTTTNSRFGKMTLQSPSLLFRFD